MSDWRSAPEMDPEVINTLIAAVGKEAFSAMKQQLIDDLRSLYGAYSEAHANHDSETARQTAHALKGAALPFNDVGSHSKRGFTAEQPGARVVPELQAREPEDDALLLAVSG